MSLRMGRHSARLIVAAIISCTMPDLCAAQSSKSEARVVRQVDHILIASSEAKELFSLLSDTFQLPVAWPMSDYGGFASGGVAVGNVNLEVIKIAEQTADAGKSRWTGFALEPEPLSTSLAELKARGIRYGSPAPFRSRGADGSFATRWTTVALPDVSSDSAEIFLCEYTHDVMAQRQRLAKQLEARGGGPLAVHSIKEIVYGAKDVKRMQMNWQKLLGPLPASSESVWPIGPGPALRVIQADQDEITALVINVASLAQARSFLEKHGLLGAVKPDAITIAGPQLQALNITLVERSSKDP